MTPEISAYKIVQAIAAIRAIEAVWQATPAAINARHMSDLAIARCDLESALLAVRLPIAEAA
ncbi:hypothetical protein G3O00_01620 [Burkholderia sp. Ac-20384]|uniref:hypothetical protein n=1 Tax=Burkholderia sp. Ac-20384 TaxID=2703902 RepID=UPI00197D0FFD|nr:hypothetical protein [Burkholderia sp. Ac-20384]MBN3822317.1 hypothetical protein [Burkholderia sp. Ac-20384]